VILYFCCVWHEDKVTFMSISNIANGLEVGSKLYLGQPLAKTGNAGTKAAYFEH